MRGHVEVQKVPERDKYYTCRRLHLPMLLNKIKNGLAQENINTNNTYVVGQILKTDISFFLVYLGNVAV